MNFFSIYNKSHFLILKQFMKNIKYAKQIDKTKLNRNKEVFPNYISGWFNFANSNRNIYSFICLVRLRMLAELPTFEDSSIEIRPTLPLR